MKLITFPGKEEITIDKDIFDNMVLSLPITTKAKMIEEFIAVATNMRNATHETRAIMYDQFVNQSIANQVLTGYHSNLLSELAKNSQHTEDEPLTTA